MILADFRIQSERRASPEEIAVLERGAAGSRDSTTGALRELAGIVRDEVGGQCGGVYGYAWRGCCEIQSLWVGEPFGRSGLGASLLCWAEQEASRLDCSHVVLFTDTSQAARFYTRHGYVVIGRVDDHPRGDAALWLRKRLDGTRSDDSAEA